jgi:hypothetical protein
MEKELQRIANTLVLYSYHINQTGLLNGKIGIVLFLYRYADYSGYVHYREFADKLLDEILNSVGHTSSDFENGLSGIGWAINLSIKNGYVDGDPDDVLQDVDKRVFSNLKYNPDTSIFGQGIYLLGRLKDNRYDTGLERHIANYLDLCINGIKEYKGQTSLYHLNSILSFLIAIEKRKGHESGVNSMRKLLPDVLKKVFSGRTFDDADLYIFNRMMEEVESERKNKWKNILLFKPLEPLKEPDTETLIKISWQEDLYFGNSRLRKMPPEEISRFINNKQESLTINDFLFPKGLAGFGNMILSAYTGSKE